MKKLFLALGLSFAILFSAAFAQPTAQGSSVGKEQTTLRYVTRYKSPEATGKAMVKLINNVQLDDPEAGCQILFDPNNDITTYHDGWEEIDADKVDTLYKWITASIPEGATAEVGVTSVKFGEADSTWVEPGVYDMLVVYPKTMGINSSKPYFAIYCAGRTDGRIKKMQLEADYTYVYESYTQVISSTQKRDRLLYIPPVDVKMEAVSLPLGHCELTEAEVTIRITNKGNMPLESCEAFYVIEDQDTVRETATFAGGLNYDETGSFTFNQKITNIDQDTITFLVMAGVYPHSGEKTVNDNYGKEIFIKKLPVSVPHTFDVLNNEIVAGLEAWKTRARDTVFYSSTPGNAITSCITMEGNKTYRLSFDAQVGYKYEFNGTVITQYNTTYGIKFGKVTEDISEWKEVAFVEDAFDEEYTHFRYPVFPEEDGEYAFCFYEDASSQGGVRMKNINIEQGLDIDVKLNSFSGLPSMIPVAHANADHSTYSANYSFVNWGSSAVEKVKLNVDVNGKQIASEEIELGDAGTVKEGSIELSLAEIPAGTEAKITATIDLPDDEYMENNSQSCTLKITEDVLAYDFVTEEMYESTGIGSYMPGTVGMPFSLSVKDTLTGIICGWAPMTVDMEIGYALYKWNKDDLTLGDLLYENIERRGMTKGERIYDVNPMILEPGDYMLTVSQLDNIFFGLLTDDTEDGLLYVTTETPVVVDKGLGSPMIRAQFNHGAKPKVKDVYVIDFTNMRDEGRFTANQDIKVMVANYGYEAVSAPLTLMINGEKKGEQTVELGAYGRKEITFNGDLSTPTTEYALQVFSALEGDEDRSNDTIFKSVYSLAPTNPYVMDFEDCDNYAIGDEFEPKWTSFDLSDAVFTNAIIGINYPHSEEPIGFIATPKLGSIEPHSGIRCGVSFDVFDANGKPMNCNAWLISPKLKITASESELSFFVKSATDIWGMDKYNVLVSTTDNKPESFQQIGQTASAPATWTKVEVSLEEYIGQEIHVAIQCVSFDAFAFMIDDIVIGGSVANETLAKDIADQLSVYPNPATEMITIHAQDAVINQVAVLNVAGMTVYQSNNLNTTDYRYSVKGLNAGIYFARVTTEQGTAVIKFVVR